MEFRFDRKEPGVWISAGTHVALLALALVSVAAPALPEAQEGVPVEVITENQFSEITKGVNPIVTAHAAAYRKAIVHYAISAVTFMEVLRGYQKTLATS